MQFRRSDYDVTNTVQVSSVASVRKAVEDLFHQTWPGASNDRLTQAFADFEVMAELDAVVEALAG